MKRACNNEQGMDWGAYFIFEALLPDTVFLWNLEVQPLDLGIENLFSIGTGSTFIIFFHMLVSTSALWLQQVGLKQVLNRVATGADKVIFTSRGPPQTLVTMWNAEIINWLNCNVVKECQVILP